jgi:hypothetical protein
VALTVTRESIVDACRDALHGIDSVQAAFLGGSESFGRQDEWSDIDLVCVADPADAADIFSAIEAALEQLSPIALKLEMPGNPTWPGLSQRFYRLRATDEFLMIDFCQVTPEQLVTFMEPTRHGKPIVLFDRTGVIKPAPLDAGHDDRMRRRIEWLRTSFPMFQNLVRKAVLRGDDVEAIYVWMSQTMRPLVDVLRARHNPERFDFGFRYTNYDLPPEVATELRELMWLRDRDDLLAKLDRARELFEQTLAEVDAQLGDG